jgi:hypothetical protein
VPKWIRRLIRAAYWRWAHDGDPWQARLVVYQLRKVELESPEHTPGTLLIAQLNPLLSGDPLIRVAELRIPELELKPNRGPDA